MGLVAPRHVGSSRTRARTRVPCIGRRILNHCATRIWAGSSPWIWALFKVSFQRVKPSPVGGSIRGRLACCLRRSRSPCTPTHPSTHTCCPTSLRQTPGPRLCALSTPDPGLLWGPLARRARRCEVGTRQEEEQQPGPSWGDGADTPPRAWNSCWWSGPGASWRGDWGSRPAAGAAQDEQRRLPLLPCSPHSSGRPGATWGG